MADASALSSALEYLSAGLSVIPIRADGSKAPACSSWDEYKTRLPTEDEIHGWFNAGLLGVAIIGGAVSGNLAVIDIEFPDFTSLWCELVEAQEPGLTANLPRVSTPGKAGQPGTHFYFRSSIHLKTGKLARLTKAEALARTGDAGKQTAIELKAEGGYVLAPGCPPGCHASGRLYTHVGGPFIEEVPAITALQADLLLSCARAIDRCPQEKGEAYVGSNPPPNGMARPGDVFNQRAQWGADVIGPHGWVLVKDRGVCYWRRPGKENGISATTGYCKSERSGDLLCLFSSNADPLVIPDGRDHQCFSKFGAYAFLNHKGNFLEAAKDLAEKGYGFDVGMSAAEALAAEMAAKVKDIHDPGAWVSVRHRLGAENLQHFWSLSEKEMDDLVTEAKRVRVERDPKLLSSRVKQEINASVATHDEGTNNGSCKGEPPWKLVIMESDPRDYLLRSPFWSQKPKVKAGGGFIKLSVGELHNWASLCRCAIEQADCSPPAKMNGWSHHLQQLLDHAEHRAAVLETRRTLLVDLFLCEQLSQAKPTRPEEDGSEKLSAGSPQPYAGNIVVKSGHLVQQAALGADNIRRKEIMEAMSRAGMKPVQLGEEKSRSRWWSITVEQLEVIRSKLAE